MAISHKFIAPMAFASAAALALSACSSPTTPESGSTATSGGSSAPKTVLTAFYPLQFLAQRIGGNLINVSSITPPGAEPHDLELTPAKVTEIGKADLVIYLKGFQTAVDEAVKANPPAAVIDVVSAVELLKEEEPGHDHDHDHEGQSGEETHDHAHEGHNHSHDLEGDPHFWLDPSKLSQAATEVAHALAEIDSANAATYTANAEKLTKELGDLATDFKTGTAQCEKTTFVTSHTAFGYLANLTGLKQVGIAGLDPDNAPSPARLKEISDIVKAEKVTTIFTETLVDPKVAQTLADDLGITTAVLDPLESQSDTSKDYIAVMKENLTALRSALACK